MRILAGPTIVAIVLAGSCLRARSPAHADAVVARDAPAAVDDEELTPRPAVGYRKGRRHAIQVVTIGWAEVEVGTARAFLRMRDAAVRAGIDLWIRSGFRTHAQQRELYQAWREGWGNRAARPGHSLHQSGRALDLHVTDPEVLAWLDGNARRFGFRRTVAGEPWHWEYVPPPRRRR
jgi:LAS superfamily LD-carboxypeptidase LdcB